MKPAYFIILILSIKIATIICESDLVSHCQWYNRFDFDVGVVFSCDDIPNGTKTAKMEKIHQIFFNDKDGVECFNKDKLIRRYYNKHIIDALRFEGCRMFHIPLNTFKAYPYLRVLDISQSGLSTLHSEHLIGAKRSWDLLAGNNEIEELHDQIFANAGSLLKVDLSFNKIKQINMQTFVEAKELMMLDLSGNQIEILNEQTFNGLVNLSHMNLAYNQITEIHPFAFVGLQRLFHLDISHNFISILEDQTFANLSKLSQLQLSYNQIHQIQSYAFATTHSLVRLDLSHNNITDEQLFDNLYNLLHLDCSHNPIGELGIGTFVKLVKLEFLDLAQSNLTIIELGTFSYTRGLISLDLSDNNLKSFDFGLFLPAFRYLESLYLDGNHLTDMEGFTNSLFPRLNSLGIANNKFNCSYLKFFMRSVDWEHIRLPVDRMPLNIHKTNIRGVACDTDEQIEKLAEATATVRSGANNANLDNAVEAMLKYLPAADKASSDSDVKVIKVKRRNGSKMLVVLV